MCRQPVTLGGGSSMVKGLASAGGGIGSGSGVGTSKRLLADPVLGPALLDDGGIVGLGKVVAEDGAPACAAGGESGGFVCCSGCDGEVKLCGTS